MKKYLQLLIILLFLFSCKKESESFEVFYDKFHQDTSFQSERIIFPLEGIPPFSETIDSSFRWQLQDWAWQVVKPKDAKLYTLGEDVVIENIYVNEYASQRRFAKFNNKWYLIYYAGINKYEK